jgi:hypothetical protein
MKHSVRPDDCRHTPHALSMPAHAPGPRITARAQRASAVTRSPERCQGGTALVLPTNGFVSFVSEAPSRLHVEDGVVADDVESTGLRTMRTAVSSRRVNATDGRGPGGCISRRAERAARAAHLLVPTTPRVARRVRERFEGPPAGVKFFDPERTRV